MRVLMWFTLGFGAVCVLFAYLLFSLPALALLALLPLLVGAAALLRRGGRFRAAGVVLIGCAAGLLCCFLLDLQTLSYVRALDGQTLTLRAEAADYSFETNYGTVVDAYVRVQGKRERIRLYLQDGAEIAPGDTVSGTFRISASIGSRTQEAKYPSGYGIYLLGYGRGRAEVTPAARIPARAFPAYVRRQVLRILDAAFPADCSPFAKALLLGDDSGIDYETNTAFSVSGIRHIIAVSGLHISILCTLLLALTGRRRILSVVLCVPVLLFFAEMASASPSVVRACVMMGLLLLARLLGRQYDAPTALSAAALGMMLACPFVVRTASFQLSVSCVAGILLFSRKLYARWEKYLPEKKTRRRKWLRAVALSTSVSVGAVSLSTPFAAWHFGIVSLMSVVTNLLTLWAVSIVFYGILLVTVLGALWMPLGKLAAIPVSWLIRYIIGTAKAIARLPAAVYTRSGAIAVWLFLVYVLFAVFLLRRRKHPEFYVAVGALGLCIALAVSWLLPLRDAVRVTVIDVGQGQCVLLQSEGKAFLVDCGGSYDDLAADAAAETLLSQGISRLDGLIVSHYDRDHYGGVDKLLTRVDADVLYLPEAGAEENTVAVSEIMTIRYKTSELTLVPGSGGDDNDRCICVLFQAGNCAILITGDRSVSGERALLDEMELPPLDLLVVGHHGAATSTGDALLAATTPRCAVISVGANSYGHPSQQVIDRLTAYGCVVLRTDEDGTVIFRR